FFPSFHCKRSKSGSSRKTPSCPRPPPPPPPRSRPSAVSLSPVGVRRRRRRPPLLLLLLGWPRAPEGTRRRRGSSLLPYTLVVVQAHLKNIYMLMIATPFQIIPWNSWVF
ncbi:Os12g0533500, partial [Oryza sativa Japonica Group]